MFKINLCLFLMFHYGLSINYNTYYTKQPQLSQATNSNSDGYNAQMASSNVYSGYQQNLQGNSNYPQLHPYYYTPPYQQQQLHLRAQQPTQLWSGPPILVEDDIDQQQQKHQSSTKSPPTFYQQHSTSSISNEFLPFLHRNSKILPPTFYNPQHTTRTNQLNYNHNNNNDNIVYHRDFRHQIDAIPESQRTQQHIVSWNNQQQQQQQHQLLEQQRPQQFYATNTNLRYNGISNGAPDYREHFKHYLENNPHRIKPIY